MLGRGGKGIRAPGTLCVPRHIEIRGFSEILRFAPLTRCPEDSRSAHGDLTARRLKKEKQNQILSKIQDWYRQFPNVDAVFQPWKIASEFADQIRNPSYKGYESLP